MKKLLIIFLSLFLSLNLSAQFKSTSMYLDNSDKLELGLQNNYITADEFYEMSISSSKVTPNEISHAGMRRAPGKPNDPYPTPIDGREFPIVLMIFALGAGLYKFIIEHQK